ncbi:MAG: exodeoxyribonuclease VII large subunit, partial [Anaerolineales bacterium]|nr:exodeoxyribonuclease VII large subunit [Anaerolineales bacterium]
EVSGQYQLYTDAIRPIGEGVLYQEFLRLKALLETEGLFDTIRKRPIPERPQRIGIVTSPSGAAFQDMLNTLRRRYPLVEVVLVASPVQGEEAPVILVASLQRLNQSVHPDVIILARGGGSIEDLWAFNDERVVRAIANSIAPIITGIGHETDFTLSDFAADLRAPTPTAAAELATPVTLLDLSASLNDLDQRLRNVFSTLFARKRDDIENIYNQLHFSSPLRRIQINRQRLDDLLQRGNRAIVHHLALSEERLNGIRQRLLSLNPTAVLERGFAVVTRLVDDSLVYHTTHVQTGDGLSIRVSDGKIGATVTKKNKPIYAN